MAFIRRVRSPSGATAVQIAEYAGDRRQRIVKYVGSAHTPGELGIVMARARQWLAEYEHAGQDALDLGLDLEPVVDLVGPAGEGVAGEVLLDLVSPGSVVSGAPVLVASGQVVGTASRLLFDVLGEVYDQLGFAAVGDEVFRDLVIARVAEPTSLLDVGRVLDDLGREAGSYNTMRRTLDRCAKGAWRDQLAELCFAYAQVSGDISLVLYDVTVRHEALVVRLEVRDHHRGRCRSGGREAEGSLTGETPGRAGAALTKPCRVSTVR